MDEVRRDRIIRYTTLPDGLLSRMDKKRNILEIDREERSFLTPSLQNLLDSSEAERTRLAKAKVGGFIFEEF